MPRAFQLGIRSFVIGAPEVKADADSCRRWPTTAGRLPTPTATARTFNRLSAIATSTCPRATDLAAALNGALDQIAAAAVSCELDMPKPEGGSLDVSKVNVDVTAPNGVEPLYQDNRAACNAGADGWQYNADKTKIILCGNACAKYKSRGASVSIQLGCRGASGELLDETDTGPAKLLTDVAVHGY